MRRLPLVLIVLFLSACGGQPAQPTGAGATAVASTEFYGTREPFAANAVYFVVTDRFVDGDPGNNQTNQGLPERGTFDRPITDSAGRVGNIGYLGGDFRGLLDHAGYIAEMGFGAVWITPIVDNPDESFTGGFRLGESMFADHGKTGYHGYWGVNFFKLDEHLPSPDLDFTDLTRELKARHGLVTVLDIVANHGSPSWTMPTDQPKFGELYDGAGTLVADHQNLPPEALDPANPLHQFFQRQPDLAQLSNLDDADPRVIDYFVAAYSQWIEQGAGALRIDTIAHVSHPFWKTFADRIRARYPGLFMFGEAFSFDAAKIAQHTWEENGRISVLDFPGQQRLTQTFANATSDYADMLDFLHLEDGLYGNPYELMSFYDNHDMPRMDASDEGFIDAHNWLFTARGIPVLYYGSEMAFRSGAPEHGGNRDYFGPDNIALARRHPVFAALKRIAQARKDHPALQRGLQANLRFAGDTAAFLRVVQDPRATQTALVLLNKGDLAADIAVDRWLGPGTWRDALTGAAVTVGPLPMQFAVPAHGVRVLVSSQPVSDPALLARLDRLQQGKRRRRSAASLP